MSKSIVIKNVHIPKYNDDVDVLIEKKIISSISEEEDGDLVIDGTGKYLIPGFVNTHTHAAMSLFRGYADDLTLQEWLNDNIWPLESKLTARDVYWGTKLACLEMIKSGTIAFNDMYFFMESAADAVREMGIKATLSYGLIDLGDRDKLESEKQKTKDFINYVKDFELIKPALGPHSVYTVSQEGLSWCAKISKKLDVPVHIHLAETESEMKDFKKEFPEYSNISDYLNETDLLNRRLLSAHCVWLEELDIINLGNSDGVVSHNPASNMKLGVGKPMNYEMMVENDVMVTLGTDGCASNNNLDMLESVKIAALQQKLGGDPTLMTAEEAYDMITKNGALALDTGGGVISEGMAADVILVDKGVRGTPGHNPISDIVYSLQGGDVTDVIINGKFVMRDRYVDGEEEIIKESTAIAKKLVKAVK